MGGAGGAILILFLICVLCSHTIYLSIFYIENVDPPCCAGRRGGAPQVFSFFCFVHVNDPVLGGTKNG